MQIGGLRSPEGGGTEPRAHSKKKRFGASHSAPSSTRRRYYQASVVHPAKVSAININTMKTKFF